MRRVGDDLLFRVVTLNPLHGIEPQAVLFQLLIPDHKPQDNGYPGPASNARRTRGRTGCVAEEVDEYALAQQHILVHQNPNGLTPFEGAKHAAGEILLLDGPASAARTVPVNKRIDQRVIHLADNEIQRMAINAVGKRTEFPIAEVSSENQHAFALIMGAGIVLKAVVDDYALDVLPVPRREMCEVCQHSSKIAEQSEQRSPSPALRPIGKGKAEIEKTHATQAWPQPIAKERQDGATTASHP